MSETLYLAALTQVFVSNASVLALFPKLCDLVTLIHVVASSILAHLLVVLDIGQDLALLLRVVYENTQIGAVGGNLHSLMPGVVS